MVRRSPPAQLCTCYHEKIQHARSSQTLQWDGECRALNTSTVDGIRNVTNCACTKFEPLQKLGGTPAETTT